MNEKKCTSQIAEHYINDLLATLEIRGENSQIFDELTRLLMRYSEEVIRASWKQVLYSCSLPNGQTAGRLPRLGELEMIFQQKNIDQVTRYHKIDKQSPLEKGAVVKLWDIGIEYHQGLITERELEKKVEELKKQG